VRLVLAHSHANTLGGGERAILEVARRLASRHDVRLLLGGYQPERTYAELADLPRSSLDRLHWPLASVAADAIVTNSFGANLLTVRNAPRVAYWVHSLRSRFLRSDARRLDLRVRRVVDWLAVRRAARVIANSQYTATRLRQLYGRAADAVVYPGVDLATFQPAPPAEPTQPGYAISVGRLSSEKGLADLLKLWRDLPEVSLHLVGTGQPAYVQWLRAHAPANVVFRGHLTGSALVTAYQSAAMAVFAARAEEFGLAPLEAMACGVPVVGWRDAGLRETVLDGSTGFLVADEVTFTQRVRWLWRERTELDAFRQAARERAALFSWQQTALGIEALCQQLAARSAGS
jgi:glycosyltransferase involved in cell wall biosynthesis